MNGTSAVFGNGMLISGQLGEGAHRAPPFFSQDFNDSSVRTSIKRIFSEHSVFVNDYALDDLLLHMFIVVQRVRSRLLYRGNPDLSVRA